MRLTGIPFTLTDWTSVEPTEHPGETGVATWRVLGWDRRMVEMWFTSWMIAWVIAAPTMFFVMPVVRRALSRVVEGK